MPVPTFVHILSEGPGIIPYGYQIAQVILVGILLHFLKRYFQGASNESERNMHSKVVMVTGGTSGIGAQVVRGLATRGAQIVLLTQHPITDYFLVQYIDDLRAETGNELITAEQVNLANLHSIRTFATKWIDNAPPRRLDMVVLCANTFTPRGGKIQTSSDDVELSWAVNYLANFHLLSILSPALRAQPPDRDVRVILGTCASYLGGDLPVEESKGGEKAKNTAKAGDRNAAAVFSPSAAYSSSKLALMTFGRAFQKHLSAYARPDKQPNNVRVLLVDPGFNRTPGMRRHLSWGSLTGLAIYLVMYPLWWLVLKSPDKGAENFLYAAMEARYGQGEGGWMIKECREVKIGRGEVVEETAQKELWQYSEHMIQEAEKRGAKARASNKAGKGNASGDQQQQKEKAASATAADAGTKASAKSPASRRTRKA